MLTSKYISCYRIFEKVHQDYGFKDKLNWITALEWIGDAIDRVGTGFALIDKVTGMDPLTPTIKIENYRGELPCDCHEVISCREYCYKIPMRYSSDTYHRNPYNDRSPDFTSNSDLTYILNNNYIFTSFDIGEVEMAYKAFPVDEKGFPLIPDDHKFIRAVTAYVAEKIAFNLWTRGELADKVYMEIKQERLWAIPAARTKADMLSLDQMETFKNSLLRTIPKTNEWNAGWLYLGQGEERKITY